MKKESKKKDYIVNRNHETHTEIPKDKKIRKDNQKSEESLQKEYRSLSLIANSKKFLFPLHHFQRMYAYGQMVILNFRIATDKENN